MTRIYDHLKDQQRNDKIKGSRLNDELDNLYTAIANAVTFANPTASVGLTAVNGVATTSMRSDAAPALSVSISPTWTGNHVWTPTSGVPITITSGGITITAGGVTITAGGLTVTAGGISVAAQDVAISGTGNGVTLKNSAGAQYGVLTSGGTGHYTILTAPSSDAFFQARDNDNGAGDAKWGYLNNDVLQITNRANTLNWVKVDTNGLLAQAGFVKSASASAGVGYATGAGGTVTQSAPKTTAVTLNKISGQITTDNSGIVAGASQGFTFTNSTIAATDVVVVSMASGGSLNSYNIMVDAVAAGSCHISMHNKTAGNLSEALVLNFAVVKAVTS